jgi:hypothetical protein
MMLRSGAIFDPTAISEDVRLVVDGRVSSWLLWEKHPAIIVGAGVLALLLLLLVHRLLFARPRRRETA